MRLDLRHGDPRVEALSASRCRIIARGEVPASAGADARDITAKSEPHQVELR